MITHISETIIPLTQLRRNFEAVTENLDTSEGFIITRRGEPFAVLKALPHVKKQILKKTAGAWKGTALDNDALWKEVAKKKSRKYDISL